MTGATDGAAVDGDAADGDGTDGDGTGARRRPGTVTGPARPVGTAVVFLASAAVLVLEIAAMRLVAPYVGITLQTSSAVIGTALAAIALGAYAGGRLADETDPGRLLPLLLVGGGLLTLLTVPAVRVVGGWMQGLAESPDAVLLALLAVFPPAAVLSAVTPVVVKTQLADLDRTGSVVGRLSGVATAGAIAATFATGFVLVPAFPTWGIVTGTGVVLVVLGAAVALLRRTRRATAALAVALLPGVPWLLAASPDPCQVESDYHCVVVEVDPPGTSGRLLRLDTLSHSYVDLADPRTLRFEYVRAMAAATDLLPAAPAPAPVRGLYIGGGGFTLPRYHAAVRPGSTARVLEIDEGVVAVGRRSLGVDAIPGLTVRPGDARTALDREPAGGYDLVIGDAFGGLAPPWHLTTREAAAGVRRSLRPGGLYLVNVIDYPPARFAAAKAATLRRVFRHVAMAAPAATWAGTGGGNVVILASDAPLPLDRLAESLRGATPGWELLDEPATAARTAGAVQLTDDFAPVDQLLGR